MDILSDYNIEPSIASFFKYCLKMAVLGQFIHNSRSIALHEKVSFTGMTVWRESRPELFKNGDSA